jgi:cytochrome c553
MRVIVLATLVCGLATAAAAAQTAVAPPGAASCSGCHSPAAAEGVVVAPLAGRPAGDTVEAMREFRDGKREATVMGRLAKGFSDDEIQALAAWFAAQH